MGTKYAENISPQDSPNGLHRAPPWNTICFQLKTTEFLTTKVAGALCLIKSSVTISFYYPEE